LLDAFGVGYGTSKVLTHLIQRTNEKNMAALTKANFPNLKKVRVLSRPLLENLDKNDGPEQECLQRWDRWWTQFSRMGVRLEDCTGALLGTLPQVDMEEEDEEYDNDTDEETGSEDGEGREGGPPRLREGTVNELRQLLEECWQMSEEREDLDLPLVSWE